MPVVIHRSIHVYMHVPVHKCNTSMGKPPRLDLARPFGWRLHGSCLWRWRGRSLQCCFQILQLIISSLKASLLKRPTNCNGFTHFIYAYLFMCIYLLSVQKTGQICYVYLRVYIYLGIYTCTRMHELFLYDHCIVCITQKFQPAFHNVHVSCWEAIHLQDPLFSINSNSKVQACGHVVPKVHRLQTEIVNQILVMQGVTNALPPGNWLRVHLLHWRRRCLWRRTGSKDGMKAGSVANLHWFILRTHRHDLIIWRHTKHMRVRMLNLKKHT